MPQVWILTWGTWGDHEPAAALARGLQAAGHTVTVFGSFCYRQRFVDLNISFSPLDGLAVLHPGYSAARQLVQTQAADAGFKGPDAVEKYLFDVIMEWWDCIEWLPADTGADSLAESGSQAAYLHGFALFGKGLDSLPEQRRSRKDFLSKRLGKTLEEYEARACRLRKACWQLFERVADETQMSPLEAMQGWHQAFRWRAKQVKSMAEYLEMVRSFHAWEESTDLEADLDSHWKTWSARLPHPTNWLGKDATECDVPALLNMRHQLGMCSVQDRPDMVVCHKNLPSTAAHFQDCGILTVPWWSITPYLTVQELMGYFATHVIAESYVPGDHPLMRIGHLPFLDMWHGKRNLLSMSAVSLRGCPVYRRHLLACCTGKWVLRDSEGGALSPSPPSPPSSLGQELEAFLATHTAQPPIYFGWGSMHSDPSRLARLVVRTLKMLGRPGIFAAGGSSVSRATLKQALADAYQVTPSLLKQAAEQLLFVESAPHELLLPRVACAVHHGGLGTFHAVLRAGLPSVIVATGADQPKNSDLLQALGCGLKGPSLADVTAETLAPLVRRVLQEPAFLTKAREVRAELLQEGGVAKAVDLLQGFLDERPAEGEAAAALPASASASASAPASASTTPPATPVTISTSVAPMPGLLEGRYDVITSFGVHREGLPLLKIASDGFLFEKSSVNFLCMGQLQAGHFTVGKDEVENTPPGEYNVRMFWNTLRYGHMTPDRRQATFSDGLRLRYSQF